jgi:hypothetical protein
VGLAVVIRLACVGNQVDVQRVCVRDRLELIDEGFLRTVIIWRHPAFHQRIDQDVIDAKLGSDISAKRHNVTGFQAGLRVVKPKPLGHKPHELVDVLFTRLGRLAVLVKHSLQHRLGSEFRRKMNARLPRWIAAMSACEIGKDLP